MQLLQAISMLLLGATVGVLCTLFDVTVVGSSAFFTRFTLWVLINVVLATHVRNRWRAVWWSIPLNLGLVESYLLCTSFSFENVSRRLMFPFALLAVVAPLFVVVAWMARHDRRNLFGRLLGVLFVLVVLGISAAMSHGLTVGNVVCVLLCMLLMFFIPTHTIAVVELDGQNNVVRTEGEGVAHHEPRERLSASRQMNQRKVRQASREERRRQKKDERNVRIRNAQGAMPAAMHTESSQTGVSGSSSSSMRSSGKRRARSVQSGTHEVSPHRKRRMQRASGVAHTAPARAGASRSTITTHTPSRGNGGEARVRSSSRPNIARRERPSEGRSSRTAHNQGQTSMPQGTSRPHKRQGAHGATAPANHRAVSQPAQRHQEQVRDQRRSSAKQTGNYRSNKATPSDQRGRNRSDANHRQALERERRTGSHRTARRRGPSGT